MDSFCRSSRRNAAVLRRHVFIIFPLQCITSSSPAGAKSANDVSSQLLLFLGGRVVEPVSALFSISVELCPGNFNQLAFDAVNFAQPVLEQ
jgi:hypothetical protein